MAPQTRIEFAFSLVFTDVVYLCDHLHFLLCFLFIVFPFFFFF